MSFRKKLAAALVSLGVALGAAAAVLFIGGGTGTPSVSPPQAPAAASGGTTRTTTAPTTPSAEECQNFVGYWNSTLKTVVGNMSWLNQSGGVTESQASADFSGLSALLTGSDSYSMSLKNEADILAVNPYDTSEAANYIVDENMFETQCGIS